MHVASFGSHSQVINSPLADRESLGIYTNCIYYIRTDRPSLFNDPPKAHSLKFAGVSCLMRLSTMLLLNIQRILDSFAEPGL